MLEKLFDRFERDYLAKRMKLQVDMVARILGGGVGSFHFENIDALFPILRVGLKSTGLWALGRHNAGRPRVVRNTIALRNLPEPFSGLRILHLSDIHIDVDARWDDGFGARLATLIEPLKFDICLITGDFRYYTNGPYNRVHELMDELMPTLECEHGVYGILGNHDFVEQTLYLEATGITMLVNQSAVIEKEGERLWIVGLDDPHFYGTHSFCDALEGVPKQECIIALIHSPEIAEEAEMEGVDLYLAGHTHGGQLCLPGGLAPYQNAHCPRERAVGSWMVGRMVGYTSAGTGSSGLPVRLNCPPEIAIHELRRI